MSLNEKLTALANSIRTKSGASGLLSLDAMKTAVDSIQTGGGGSLPSVISKIDGGSFTLASDTLIANYAIEHNLGVAPTGVLIWSNNDGGAYSVITVSWMAKAVTEREAEVLVNVGVTGTTNYGTQGLTPNGLTSTEFFFRRNNVYYKAGTTYNWLAWA